MDCSLWQTTSILMSYSKTAWKDLYSSNFLVALMLVANSVFQCSRVTCSESLQDNLAVQRFREYLRIPTVQPDPNYDPAINFLVAQGDEIGLNATILEYVQGKPILVLTWVGSNSSLASIVLSSHMDVVEVEIDKWDHDPFEAYMDDDGNIFARGSQDMKVNAIQYLEAIRNLKASRFTPLRTIHVLFVPDEEVGGAAGWGALAEASDFADLNPGIVLDEGFFMDNSTAYVLYAEKAPWWLVVQVMGEPEHGSDNSASENLLNCIESISRYRESQFDLIKGGASYAEVVTVNPVFLKAGSPTPTKFIKNIQPASVGYDIRVPPNADVATDLERRIAEEWAPASQNLSYWFEQKFETEDGQPPITMADKSNPWWDLLGTAMSKFGTKLLAVVSSASTDARYVRRRKVSAFGITPVANLPQLAHGHNEYMNAWKFLDGIKVYEQILIQYASFSG